MADWYYLRDEERIGPVSEDQMRSRLAKGEVSPQVLVWAEGLPTWVCPKDAPGLSGESTSAPVAIEPTYLIAANASAVAVQPLTSAVATVAPIAPVAPVAYFTPAGNLPQRAEMTLRGHAAPQGDVGDWPLDDVHISQFEETLRLRKRVSSTANNYRALMVLSALLAAVFVLVSVIELSQSRPNSTSAAMGTGFCAVLMLGISALYFFTWRATIRSQRWAPLTMFIFFLTGCLTSVIGIVTGLSSPIPGGPVFAGVLGLVIGLLFATTSWRAFAAIPKYLSQPAWCQELVVKAKL